MLNRYESDFALDSFFLFNSNSTFKMALGECFTRFIIMIHSFGFTQGVWDNSLLYPKKATDLPLPFLHGYDSLGKIELLNKPFRKAIPCIFTITQIKQLYH